MFLYLCEWLTYLLKTLWPVFVYFLDIAIVLFLLYKCATFYSLIASKIDAISNSPLFYQVFFCFSTIFWLWCPFWPFLPAVLLMLYHDPHLHNFHPWTILGTQETIWHVVSDWNHCRISHYMTVSFMWLCVLQYPLEWILTNFNPQTKSGLLWIILKLSVTLKMII